MHREPDAEVEKRAQQILKSLPPGKGWYKLTELGAGRTTVFKWIREGAITTRSMGGRRVVLAYDYARFLASLPVANSGSESHSRRARAVWAKRRAAATASVTTAPEQAAS